MKTLLICASIAGMLTIAANAADITWQTPANITGTSDVNTQGTLYGSWAPGDDYQGDFNSVPQNYTVNGVAFNTYGTPGVDFGISGTGINLDRYNGFTSPNTQDFIYNDLLQVAVFNYNANTSDMIVSWDNLIVGHAYLVQAWLNDGRTCCGSGSSTFTGGANTSAPVAIGNGVPGQYIIGTYVADSGSQSFTMSPGIMLNLVQVRDISPTPSVTWQTPTHISGPSDVNTNGVYFGSWAPNNQDADNGSGGLEVNGAMFVMPSDLPNFFIVGFDNGGASFNDPNTSDANYNDLLQTGTNEDVGDGRPVSLSWTGMKPGHTYQVQLWANDGSGNGRTETFTGGANTSATLDFGDAPGEYVVGTFVADSGGRQVISLSGSNSPNGDFPQVNLVQVRDLTTTPDITWQAPTNIFGPSDVVTNGAYFASWAPYNQDSANNGSSGLVVNGTKFLAFSDFPDFSTIGFNNGYNGYNNPHTSDTNYNDLLQTAAYEGFGDGRPVSFSWGGLTPGHTYLVQLWANDGRGNGRTEEFTGGGNTSATVDFGDPPGEFIVGTFVANNTGLQTIDLSGVGSPNGDYPQLNLVQVRDLTPTPRITSISVSGTTLNISATHGSNNGQYVLLTTATLGTPLNQWTPILTNNLDSAGNLNLSTNILSSGVHQQFFILKQ